MSNTSNKVCLIYQPLGLGDIFWVQQIVDTIISDGYVVYYPVGGIYYDIVSSYIKKKNLIWVREEEDFPLKQYYGQMNVHQTEGELYIPLSYADRYIPNSSVMISKYYFLSIPIGDYRKHFKIDRNYKRENNLIQKYGLIDDYILVNRSFGTEAQERDIKLETNLKVHYMNIQEDRKNGFHIFDWIMALENAKQIHTVETSLCYLIDKYCLKNEIHMYEKRTSSQSNTYYNNVNLVYRNPNWIYEN
jgi:hypothetical protein